MAVSVQAAENVLVPVDDRTGHDAAAVREQEDHEVGDLTDLAELAHGQRLPGLLLPAVGRAVELPLGCVLAVGGGPADVEAVNPDAVPAVSVRGVPGRTRQAGLGR